MRRPGDGEEIEIEEEDNISARTGVKETFGSCATVESRTRGGTRGCDLGFRNEWRELARWSRGVPVPEPSWTVAADAEDAGDFSVAARGDIVADADASMSIAAAEDVASSDSRCFLDRATV